MLLHIIHMIFAIIITYGNVLIPKGVWDDFTL